MKYTDTDNCKILVISINNSLVIIIIVVLINVITVLIILDSSKHKRNVLKTGVIYLSAVIMFCVYM